MATTARPRNHRRQLARRMWIVARQATATCACHVVRVSRVHVLVTHGTRGSRCGAHVVRRMAIGTNRMRWDLGLCEHDNGRVTRATRDRSALLELVGAMTTHTLRMPAREQRRGRHERLRLTMAFGARDARRRGGRVLLGVAGGAYAVRRLAERGVGRRDSAVAVHAWARNGLLILVRTVATHAGRRRVNDDGRDRSLRPSMTTRAVTRRVRREHSAVVGGSGPAIAGSIG